MLLAASRLVLELVIRPTYVNAGEFDPILFSHIQTIAFWPIIFPTNARDNLVLSSDKWRNHVCLGSVLNFEVIS